MNGSRLAQGEFGHQASGARFATDTALDVLTGRHDLKIVSSFRKQFPPARRRAGEYDVRPGTTGWVLEHATFTRSLPLGDSLTTIVAAASKLPPAPSLQPPAPNLLEVLYEDNHLLAVNKPAMLPTMGVADDRPSLLSEAKEYIRRKYNKPGNVYLGIISRLDAPVTGVVLLARTSKAAGRLAEQFRERNVDKVYWAVVDGKIEPPAGRLVDYLRKDERHRRMHIASPNATGAQCAELTYRIIGANQTREEYEDDAERPVRQSLSLSVSLSAGLDWASLLEIRPLTGRKHQIRLQLSHAGFPIMGDRKYGSQRPFSPGIALHSRRLAVVHPVSKMQIVIESPPPRAWQRFFAGRV